MKIDRLGKSFGYAWQGIRYAVRSQQNMQIHLVMAVLVVIAGIVYRLTLLEWAIISLTIGAVLAAEAFNTAIELVVDLVTDKPHPLAGHAKNVAAAAVLMTTIAAVAVGICIFGPYLLG